jgi:hypothetical protein
MLDRHRTLSGFLLAVGGLGEVGFWVYIVWTDLDSDSAPRWLLPLVAIGFVVNLAKLIWGFRRAGAWVRDEWLGR